MNTIVIPEEFTPWNVMDWLQNWERVARVPLLRIDFSHCTFCGTGGIAMLASCLSHRRNHCLNTAIIINPEHDVFRYLSQIDFFESLGVHTAEQEGQDDINGRYVPLKGITTEIEARDIATQIINFIREQVDEMPTSLFNYSRFLLDELGANIVQHAEAGNTGFGVGQAYTQQGILECAYSDYGIGILGSLSKNLEFLSRIEHDEEAIRLAIEDEVSSNPDHRRNMGAGLYECDRICRRLNGELWVLSGTACLYKKYHKKVCRVDKTVSVPHYHGTWICFRLPLEQV